MLSNNFNKFIATLTADINVINNKNVYNYQDIKFDSNKYLNKYEEEILKDKDNKDYKIINISGKNNKNLDYKGYLVVVYKPENIKLKQSSLVNVGGSGSGETLQEIALKNKAKVAINAGGFFDPNWNSNGGIPHGDVISNYNLLSTYKRGISTGGLIGFDKDNNLVLKNLENNKGVNEFNYRDAVDFGPFLIVNSKLMFENNSNDWNAPRTIIAQRKDKIVLFLVIDGQQEASSGIGYGEYVNILKRYNVINAANLDGGTSTGLVVNNEYLNNPHNGIKRTLRRIPNAFIVE